jgi:hypothetical protein
METSVGRGSEIGARVGATLARPLGG